jgi:hypothetical protein
MPVVVIVSKINYTGSVDGWRSVYTVSCCQQCPKDHLSYSVWCHWLANLQQPSRLTYWAWVDIGWVSWQQNWFGTCSKACHATCGQFMYMYSSCGALPNWFVFSTAVKKGQFGQVKGVPMIEVSSFQEANLSVFEKYLGTLFFLGLYLIFNKFFFCNSCCSEICKIWTSWGRLKESLIQRCPCLWCN